MEEYRKIVSKIAGGDQKFIIIRDVRKEEYRQLLGNSSIIITFGSSILLEAIALGKRTMVIDPFSADSPLPLLYPHIGSTPCRRWDDDLIPTFKFLLQHQHELALGHVLDAVLEGELLLLLLGEGDFFLKNLAQEAAGLGALHHLSREREHLREFFAPKCGPVLISDEAL